MRTERYYLYNDIKRENIKKANGGIILTKNGGGKKILSDHNNFVDNFFF